MTDPSNVITGTSNNTQSTSNQNTQDAATGERVQYTGQSIPAGTYVKFKTGEEGVLKAEVNAPGVGNTEYGGRAVISYGDYVREVTGKQTNLPGQVEGWPSDIEYYYTGPVQTSQASNILNQVVNPVVQKQNAMARENEEIIRQNNIINTQNEKLKEINSASSLNLVTIESGSGNPAETKQLVYSSIGDQHNAIDVTGQITTKTIDIGDITPKPSDVMTGQSTQPSLLLTSPKDNPFNVSTTLPESSMTRTTPVPGYQELKDAGITSPLIPKYTQDLSPVLKNPNLTETDLNATIEKGNRRMEEVGLLVAVPAAAILLPEIAGAAAIGLGASAVTGASVAGGTALGIDTLFGAVGAVTAAKGTVDFVKEPSLGSAAEIGIGAALMIPGVSPIGGEITKSTTIFGTGLKSRSFEIKSMPDQNAAAGVTGMEANTYKKGLFDLERKPAAKTFGDTIFATAGDESRSVGFVTSIGPKGETSSGLVRSGDRIIIKNPAEQTNTASGLGQFITEKKTYDSANIIRTKNYAQIERPLTIKNSAGDTATLQAKIDYLASVGVKSPPKTGTASLSEYIRFDEKAAATSNSEADMGMNVKDLGLKQKAKPSTSSDEGLRLKEDAQKLSMIEAANKGLGDISPPTGNKFLFAPITSKESSNKVQVKGTGFTGIEMENLQKIADKKGVSRDVVDWKAEIDTTLTYGENKNILSQKIQNIAENRPQPQVTKKEAKLQEDEGFNRYVEGLQWKAEAGDKGAEEELKLYNPSAIGTQPPSLFGDTGKGYAGLSSSKTDQSTSSKQSIGSGSQLKINMKQDDITKYDTSRDFGRDTFTIQENKQTTISLLKPSFKPGPGQVPDYFTPDTTPPPPTPKFFFPQLNFGSGGRGGFGRSTKYSEKSHPLATPKDVGLSLTGGKSRSMNPFKRFGGRKK